MLKLKFVEILSAPFKSLKVSPVKLPLFLGIFAAFIIYAFLDLTDIITDFLYNIELVEIFVTDYYVISGFVSGILLILLLPLSVSVIATSMESIWMFHRFSIEQLKDLLIPALGRGYSALTMFRINVAIVLIIYITLPVITSLYENDEISNHAFAVMFYLDKILSVLLAYQVFFLVSVIMLFSFLAKISLNSNLINSLYKKIILKGVTLWIIGASPILLLYLASHYFTIQYDFTPYAVWFSFWYILCAHAVLTLEVLEQEARTYGRTFRPER